MLHVIRIILFESVHDDRILYFFLFWKKVYNSGQMLNEKGSYLIVFVRIKGKILLPQLILLYSFNREVKCALPEKHYWHISLVTPWRFHHLCSYLTNVCVCQDRIPFFWKKRYYYLNYQFSSWYLSLQTWVKLRQ